MNAKRLELYQQLQELRNSHVITVINGDRPQMETQLSGEMVDILIKHLDTIGVVPKISLFLYTRGGDTLAAWSLVNLILLFCDELEIIVPEKCHSAGTLICLGANSIIMTKQATLGPIDPSVNTLLNPTAPNNPQMTLPVSVEAIEGYISLAQDKLQGAQPSDMVPVLLKLADTVHPVVLGQVYRARTQIKRLAERLLDRQVDDTFQRDKIVDFLCSDSGSHDYTINRREAKNHLGLKIEKPSEDLYELIKEIFDDIRTEMKLRLPYTPEIELAGSPETKYSCRRALIESCSCGTDVFVTKGFAKSMNIQEIIQMPNHGGLPPELIQRTLLSGGSIITNTITFEGWEHEEN